ncbi:hypothetical protein [Ramlibacter alkalitolerans]|uniref:Amino acid transporter n=1 Tax=Ramlibacter alkalitolerans TaxID=2039631 RepID=A0ABS1JWM9_9BURK|nr:hypothetical protein [Ramlibacter alkalitolerans]MBL0428725.1 hypothetical protein [Ramlibacter alkalitolerans]
MTLISFTAALVVTAALGVAFRATRGIGIGAVAALCFLYPWLSVVVLILAGALAFYLLGGR